MVMILDACVAVKLFVKEPLSDLAIHIFEEYSPFLAPDLIRIEVSSAITRKARHKSLPTHVVYTKLKEWREFLTRDKTIELIPSEELLADAEKFSIELCHPLKDCLYLAAAKQHNAPLVTADKPFIDSLGGCFPNVRHLSEFGA